MLVTLSHLQLFILYLGYCKFSQLTISFFTRYFTVNGIISPRSHQLERAFYRASRYEPGMPAKCREGLESRLGDIRHKCIGWVFLLLSNVFRALSNVSL